MSNDLDQYIRAVRSLTLDLQRTADKFRFHQRAEKDYSEVKLSADYWRCIFFGDALIRLRQLIEVNFTVIETMGLLAVTRYVFELSIWVRLISGDRDFALEYFYRLLDANKRYYEDLIAQLNREVRLLTTLDEKESNSSAAVREAVIAAQKAGKSTEDIAAIIQGSMDSVDAEADELFSMYADQAKVNGFGYQAYFVSETALPKARKGLGSVQEQLSDFEGGVDPAVLESGKKRWNWKNMAKRVDMNDEYEFIYTYTSRLMHATPASLTTNQKNLETPEMAMFMRYVRVKVEQILEIAKAQPESNLLH